ncbi:hypothetical protein [Segatella copri]|uniref:Uncharacterized protein n=2 Tax=Segatella copri TaxID=165179 RepID=A0A3R6H7F0_9BACT|nr:hypothetical protein [Segatella copri]RHG37250.1 hypothetical protein DW263_02100 [Segatella copri]RHG38993.1 hypothetical protein DW262_03195 [Segatella copri]RHG67091.1 hypothetical protein DW250_05400 [Segatella copri]
MKEKINIAEILKDKPVNTKLYSPLFSEVYFSHVSGGYIAVEHHGGTSLFLSSGKFYDYDGAEPLLFPSKEMRDWSKFSWKKGDILVNKDAEVHIIFDGFKDDTYKTFYGQYYLWEEEDSIVNFEENEDYMQTSEFYKANKEEAQTYISTIEERLGGKLNRETLEVEKPQPEFKDGDIVMSDSGTIVLVRGISLTRKIYYHAYMRNEYIYINQVEGEFFSRVSRIKRFATDSEKQQLFDALAKEGKRWDSEHKMIVDLKPKVEFKPFDKVLVRNTDTEEWFPGFFEKFDSTWNNPYHIMNRRSMTDFAFKQCIPYIGNESLLGTTNNVEG